MYVAVCHSIGHAPASPRAKSPRSVRSWLRCSCNYHRIQQTRARACVDAQTNQRATPSRWIRTKPPGRPGQNIDRPRPATATRTGADRIAPDSRPADPPCRGQTLGRAQVLRLCPAHAESVPCARPRALSPLLFRSEASVFLRVTRQTARGCNRTAPYGFLNMITYYYPFVYSTTSLACDGAVHL